MIILSVINLVPMRTFAGFSHYALSPPRRRPPPGGEESLQTLRLALRRLERAACREDALPYGSAATRLPRRLSAPEAVTDRRRAIGSAGERLVHTEEVTGSIPVSPTDVSPGQRLHGQLSSDLKDGSFCRIGRNLGDRVPRLVPERGKQMPGGADGECGQAGMTARRITAW